MVYGHNEKKRGFHLKLKQNIYPEWNKNVD